MTNRITVILWSFLIVLPLGQALGQHALDNNLQEGNRGVNPTARTPDFAARNNLVTGNVGGLRSFRGAVDYISPGDFAGSLGTDDLFRFRARSISLDYAGTSILRGSRRVLEPIYRGIPAVSARDLNSVATGDAGSSQSVLLPPRDAGAMRFSVSYGAGTAALGATDEAKNTLGTLRLPQGKTVEVRASPLLGIRSELIRRDPAAAIKRTDGTAESAPDTIGDREMEIEVDTDAASTTLGTAPPSADTPLMTAATLEIGRKIMAAIQFPQISSDADEPKQPAEEVEMSQIIPRPTPTAQPGEDIYTDLLRQIGNTPNLPDIELPEPDIESPAHDIEGTASPEQPMLDVVLEDPTPEMLRQAAQDRLQALRLAQGLPELSGVESDKGMLQGADEDQTQLPVELEQLLKTLDYNLPPLPSLAGHTDSRVNDLFRKAESQLAAGKYFSAERTYRLILHYRADHPLAQAGLIHAQLSSGLIRLAVLNLRQLCTQHPEVIATRYQAHLLPARTRLQWLRGQLEMMIKTSERPEPPLMLAYLGYQSRTPKLVRFGLDLAQTRSPRDPLLPVLRRIWLEPAAKPGAMREQAQDKPSIDTEPSSPTTPRTDK